MKIESKELLYSSGDNDECYTPPYGVQPFALIMTNTWLNDSAPKQLFMNDDLQLLMFDSRMKFISPDGRPNDKITFSSSYYCWNFLPKQIIMKKLIIPKAAK